MPTYGGYYMCPKECWRWLEIYYPEKLQAGLESAAPAVSNALRWLLIATKRTSRFCIELVPAPDPLWRGKAWDLHGLMLVRRSSERKKYLAPDTRPGRSDLRSKRTAEKHAHVKLSDWKVIWYDGTKDIDEMVLEVLQPSSESSV